MIAAQAAGDYATLVRAYSAEARHLDAEGLREAACFYLTQAYVWALHGGHPDTVALHEELKRRGREE